MRGPMIAPAAAVLLCAVACVPSFADEASDRAKLIGTWQPTSGEPATWTLEQNGDALRITESQSDREVSKLECTVGGQECQVKDDGHKAKVSLWYNGGKLVEMETRGSEVFKRRFSANGDEMEIEVIPIVPDGKPQVLKLKRTKVEARQ
jgi:hypothetical protein